MELKILKNLPLSAKIMTAEQLSIELFVTNLSTTNISTDYIYAASSNLSANVKQIQKNGVEIAKIDNQSIYSPSADLLLDLTSNNAIANSAVTSAFNDLSTKLSSYLQQSGPDQKIHSTPFDVLTMVDQAQPGEEGHNLYRNMIISCGTWTYIESTLPDEIDMLEIANNDHDNKLITTTTYLKGN